MGRHAGHEPKPPGEPKPLGLIATSGGWCSTKHPAAVLFQADFVSSRRFLFLSRNALAQCIQRRVEILAIVPKIFPQIAGSLQP